MIKNQQSDEILTDVEIKILEEYKEDLKAEHGELTEEDLVKIGELRENMIFIQNMRHNQNSDFKTTFRYLMKHDKKFILTLLIKLVFYIILFVVNLYLIRYMDIFISKFI